MWALSLHQGQIFPTVTAKETTNYRSFSNTLVTTDKLATDQGGRYKGGRYKTGRLMTPGKGKNGAAI